MNKDVLAAGNRALFGLNGALLAGTISTTPTSRSCGHSTRFQNLRLIRLGCRSTQSTRLRIGRLGFESLAARTASARWRGHVCLCSSGSPGWIAVASDPSGELSGAVSRPVARRSQGSTVTALATATSSSLSHNGRWA
jgi:hypothetical protein